MANLYSSGICFGLLLVSPLALFLFALQIANTMHFSHPSSEVKNSYLAVAHTEPDSLLSSSISSSRKAFVHHNLFNM